MKAFLAAERVGLIRCFASHPLWGRTHCVRRPHACWHESNPLLGFEPLDIKHKTPDLPGLCVLCGEGGIDSLRSPFGKVNADFSSHPRRPDVIKRQKKLPRSPKAFLAAERVGFEPTVRINAQRFSRPPDSAALAPLPAFF